MNWDIVIGHAIRKKDVITNGSKVVAFYVLFDSRETVGERVTPIGNFVKTNEEMTTIGD